MRYRYEQIRAYMLQKSANDRTSHVPPELAIEACKRLRMITERTYILDSFETKILMTRFEPVEMWYFQDFVNDSFIRATKDYTTDSCSSIGDAYTYTYT